MSPLNGSPRGVWSRAAHGCATSADALVADTRSLGTVDAEATDQATARELIKLAIDKVCPDQRDRVDDF